MFAAESEDERDAWLDVFVKVALGAENQVCRHHHSSVLPLYQKIKQTKNSKKKDG